MIRTKRTRRGFTLVEVLVAAALAIWGMWLITWLYQQGLDSFRQAHAQSELTSQLRMAKTIMQRDLSAYHFPNDDTKPNAGRRLSDQHPELMLSNGYVPPKGGYFRAGSPDQLQSYEGVGADTNGFYSWRANNHFLQFTSILPGGSDSQVFTALVPASGSPSPIYDTAAEITYYMRPTGSQTPTNVPLYDLYRVQRVVAQTSDEESGYTAILASAITQLGQGPGIADASEVMVVNTFKNPPQVATLGGLTLPQGIPGVNSVRETSPPNGLPAPYTFRYGEDKLLSNVISFEVKFTGPVSPTTQPAYWPSAPSPTPQGWSQWPRPSTVNSDYPYDFLPWDGYFDTGSSQLPNWTTSPQSYMATATNPSNVIKPIRITGVQVHIRAYDPKTRATRQTTLIVDL